MKKIPLSRGMVTLVDDLDYEWLSQWKWYAARGGATFYAGRSLPRSAEGRGAVWMHRLILSVPPGIDVDHRNGNGLDNRRINLRSCNRSQNACNMRPIVGSSRFKGVWWHKSNKKWKAQVKLNAEVKWQAGFDSEVEAAQAYDKAAKKYHGEFARLNFPE